MYKFIITVVTFLTLMFPQFLWAATPPKNIGPAVGTSSSKQGASENKNSSISTKQSSQKASKAKQSSISTKQSTQKTSKVKNSSISTDQSSQKTSKVKNTATYKDSSGSDNSSSTKQSTNKKSKANSTISEDNSDKDTPASTKQSPSTSNEKSTAAKKSLNSKKPDQKDDESSAEVLARNKKIQIEKFKKSQGKEIVLLDEEINAASLKVLKNTDQIDSIREDLKNANKKSALAYLLDKGITIKVFVDNNTLKKVNIAFQNVKYLIVQSKFKGEIQKHRLPLLLDAQSLQFLFDSKREALEFFSTPGHGQLTPNGFVPFEKHYIENGITGEVFEYDVKTRKLKEIRRQDIPLGRNIGAVYFENNELLLSELYY